MTRLPRCHTRNAHHQLPTFLTPTTPTNDVDDATIDEQAGSVREDTDD